MRLTRKIEPQVLGTFTFPKYDYNRDNYGALLSSTESVINKLGQLEDNEEELGIDLITLFKALKYPIYVKETNETWWRSNRLYFGLPEAFIVITDLNGKDIILPLKEYGKSWALTKEELEND